MEEQKGRIEKRLEEGVFNINEMTLAIQRYGLGMHAEDATTWDKYKYHILLVISICCLGFILYLFDFPNLSRITFFLGGLMVFRMIFFMVTKQ